ncbi:uncharacterized protein LOC126175361 isoform X2 [Schistocerca cancellata]|uniref:uncharacterized protein LOC126175361 isoform X2 n=1 Tax=Schistocerca cancellata TaxID=274614 RepID=UPI002118F3ED|nr:uncharacterized protein LOC126175361 isoform X2 [Schistocerca cancellata]
MGNDPLDHVEAFLGSGRNRNIAQLITETVGVGGQQVTAVHPVPNYHWNMHYGARLEQPNKLQTAMKKIQLSMARMVIVVTQLSLIVPSLPAADNL